MRTIGLTSLLALFGISRQISLRSQIGSERPRSENGLTFQWGESAKGFSNMIIQPDSSTIPDATRFTDRNTHLAVYKGQTIKVTRPGFDPTEWNDRWDLVGGRSGLDTNPYFRQYTTSFKLTGTNKYLCYDGQKLVLDEGGQSFPSASCSFWFSGGEQDTYNRIMLAGTLSCVNFDENTQTFSLKNDGCNSWMMHSALTTAPAPYVARSPPETWESISTDANAGKFPNGTLPTLGDELAFFKAQTSALCQAPYGFSWTSVFDAISGISNQGAANSLANARSEGYNAGLAAGNQTGFTLGLTQGQTAGYQAGFANGLVEGNSTGFAAGFNAGKLAGAQESYQQGVNAGIAQGRVQGYDEGRAAGVVDGRNEGFNSGKAAGITEGKASCTKFPDGTSIQIRNVTDNSGNTRKETTITSPDKVLIITEWDTFVPPPHIHHKLVEERWSDGRRNVTYTQTTNTWVWINVTSTASSITTTTITNHTINIYPQVDQTDITIVTPSGSVTNHTQTVLDPPRTTTTTERDTPDGRHEQKVVVEDSSTGDVRTTTTITYIDSTGQNVREVQINERDGHCNANYH